MITFGNANMGFFQQGASGGGGGGSVTSVGATAPLVATPNPITDNGTLSIPVATSSADGYLSSANWTAFNSKVGGSGTTNYIPKFTGSGTLGNSLLIDNSTYVQLGVFTIGANVVSTGSVTFATQGAIGTSNGLYLNDPASNYTKQGVYRGSNRLDFFAGGGEQLRINLSPTNGFLQIFRGFNNTAGSSIAITGGINVDANNSSNYTFFNVTPTINQSSGGFLGSGQIRGYYYNPTITSLGGTTVHNAWENTSGDIVFGNLTGSNTEVVMINSSGKLVKQNAQTSFNLYQGTTAVGLMINYTADTYTLGNTASNKTYLTVAGDSISFFYNSINDGLFIDFPNSVYRYGYLNNTSSNNVFLLVSGAQGTLSTVSNDSENGLMIDFSNDIYKIGDYAGINSGVKLEIDSANNEINLQAPSSAGNIVLSTDPDSGTIELQTNQLKFDVPTVGSAGALADYLLVYVNNVQYKIELYSV
jgi:hypothetical protein